jgi:hypothetical protein
VIYAKLDVCFWRHKKFRRAGVAAAGYWAAALAYLREDDSDDGFLPGDVVGQLLGVTEAEGRAFCQVLVQVGLFAARDDGYLLVGYTTKNESRKQIEARKAANARKVASWRAKARGGSDSVTDDVTSDVTGYSAHDVTGYGTRDVTSGAGLVTSSGETPVTLPSCTGSGSDSDLRSGSDARARVAAETTRLTGASDSVMGMQVDAYSEGIRAVTGAPRESGPFEVETPEYTKRAGSLASRAETRSGSDPVTGDVTGYSNHDVTRSAGPVTSSDEHSVTLPSCTGSGSGSDSDLRSGSDARARAGEVTTLRLAPRAADAPTTGYGLMGMQVDAYGEGIQAVTGVPYVKSGPFEAKTLEECAKRAGGLTGRALLDWYRAKAEKFARSVNPRFGYGANRFVGWLNGGERADTPEAPASTRDLSRPESRNLNNLGAGLPPLPPIRAVRR